MGRRVANVFYLGTKELRSLIADPVLLLLLLYVFTFAVYTVATGANFEVKNASIAIVDEDQSELSRAIAGALLPPFFKSPEAIAVADIDAAMDAGRYVFVVQIPSHFERDVLADKNPGLQINVDATAMTQAGNGAAYLHDIITQEIVSFAERREADIKLPVNLVVRSLFNPNLKSEWFTSVMQVINNITMLSVILTGAALIRERERGTIEHLLVMPMTAPEIMLSKIWANGLVILVAAILSLWIVVEWLLQVRVAGSIGLFVAGALIYQFSVTALGLLLATFATSMPQFGLLVMPVLIIMNLLSGSTTPLESMPVWLQYAMQLSPSTHFVAFAQAVLYRGASVEIIWPGMLAMAMISAAFFVVVLLRFRKAIAAS